MQTLRLVLFLSMFTSIIIDCRGQNTRTVQLRYKNLGDIPRNYLAFIRGIDRDTLEYVVEVWLDEDVDELIAQGYSETTTRKSFALPVCGGNFCRWDQFCDPGSRLCESCEEICTSIDEAMQRMCRRRCADYLEQTVVTTTPAGPSTTTELRFPTSRPRQRKIKTTRFPRRRGSPKPPRMRSTTPMSVTPMSVTPMSVV